MKIVVLAGGLSPERNVSLSSGTMIAHALQSLGHQAALVDMYIGLEDYSGPLEAYFDEPLDDRWRSIAPEAPDLEEVKASRKVHSPSQFGRGVLELCQLADLVFLALHGTCGEDGRVQAAFDLLGIPYTGAGYLGSAIAMDKDLTKRCIAHLDVKTPKWQRVQVREEAVADLAAAAPIPCVVKPVASGSSIGVYIAYNRDSLQAALRQSIATGGDCVLEEYVMGREIQVALLEDRALPSIEIIPKAGFYDYENKYQPGAAEEVTPAPIPPAWEEAVENAALTVYRALGLKVYSRADFIVDPSGTPWFLEINTLPGMTPTSLVPQEAAAVGIDYPGLCQIIVEESLRLRGK